jgi:phage gpG-like protein
MANLSLQFSDRNVGLPQALISRVLNPEPILKRFAQYKLQKIDDCFRNETDPEGNPWREPSDKWKKRKKLLGGRPKKGQFRGNLRSSIQVRELTGDTLVIAPDTVQIPYAARQQFGTVDRPELAMPYLGFITDDRVELESLTLEYLLGG